MVRAIKVDNFTKDILKIVVLVSNPFPMIFTYDQYKMYTLTLNGDMIEAKEIENKNINIIPCIDKNFGLISDFIFIEEFKSGDNNTKNIIKKIILPFLLEDKNNEYNIYKKDIFSSVIFLFPDD